MKKDKSKIYLNQLLSIILIVLLSVFIFPLIFISIYFKPTLFETFLFSVISIVLCSYLFVRLYSIYKYFLALNTKNQKLKTKESSTQLFINSLPGVFSIFNENLQYYDCNDQLLNILKMDKKDLIGQPLGFVHHNNQFAERIEQFNLNSNNFESFELEEENDFSEEKKFYFCLLSKNNLEEGMQISALSIDFTDLRKKEKALELKRIELVESEKLITLGELAAGLSHEVNNPMAIISGRVQVLLRKIETNDINTEAMKSSLLKIMETTQRVKRIVHSLKIISKESNDINMRDYTTQDVLDPLMALYGHRLFFEGIEFAIDNKFQDLIIKCSLAELSQVVLHLIKNSIDAIKTLEEKWVRIELYKIENQNKIQIWFIDSGLGIPEPIQIKIFEPFFTTKNTNGTGVGLASARDMMRKQGGDLFYNKDYPNTCFILELTIS